MKIRWKGREWNEGRRTNRKESGYWDRMMKIRRKGWEGKEGRSAIGEKKDIGKG